MSYRDYVAPIGTLIGIAVAVTSALVDLGHKTSARVAFIVGAILFIVGGLIWLSRTIADRTPQGKIKLAPSGVIVNASLARAILQNTKDNLQTDEFDRAGCSEDEFNDCIEVLSLDGYVDAVNAAGFQQDYDWVVNRVTLKGKRLLARLSK